MVHSSTRRRSARITSVNNAWNGASARPCGRVVTACLRVVRCHRLQHIHSRRAGLVASVVLIAPARGSSVGVSILASDTTAAAVRRGRSGKV